MVTRWQQLLLRPGVNYQVSPNVLLTAGYAFIRTYPYGEFPVVRAFPEHRIYQQLLVTNRRPGVTFQHRPRLEQRFIRYPTTQPPAWTYQNRFRYMLRAEVPLTKRRDGTTSWYLPATNEIFIGFAPNYGARPFDQNRLTVGVGHASRRRKIEVSYLNQFLGQRNGRVFEFNNTLLVSVTSSLPVAHWF